MRVEEKGHFALHRRFVDGLSRNLSGSCSNRQEAEMRFSAKFQCDMKIDIFLIYGDCQRLSTVQKQQYS